MTDLAAKSWIAYADDSSFPIQNLPYGVFCPRSGEAPRVGVAIGDFVLDLAALEELGLLTVPASPGQRVFNQSSLNPFMALGLESWRHARAEITRLLRADIGTIRDDKPLRDRVLHPIRKLELRLPIEIGDYTDFYASREHATNVGRLVRGPENALFPNWLHLPVAYHGRASSVVVSGTPIVRPSGQRMTEGGEVPVFGPSRALDYELEVGFVIGTGNPLGTSIPVDRAWDHVFGAVLVNDWSARDLQKWEYQPLGPFLSKSFATSISPWVVPLEALHRFRTTGPDQNPRPLPYLAVEENTTFDLRLEASIRTATMRDPERICATNLRYLYWNIAQQVAHHTVAGCNLRTGDLLATGTISGPHPESQACLLERTLGGQKPLTFSNGESRRFLEDGDTVTISGECQGPQYRIGFGEVQGTIRPA